MYSKTTRVDQMYGKWFASTYTGSMMGAGSNVFAVWGWVIANAGPSGVLEINPKLLAAVIGESVERVEDAINYLTSKDPESRSSEEGGRRLIHEGGFQYRVVNHATYRAIVDEEARREYNRTKQRESRQRRGLSNGESTMSAHTEGRRQTADPEAISTNKYHPDFLTFWEAYPSRGAKSNPKNHAYAAWRKVTHAGDATPEQLVEAARKYAVVMDIKGATGTGYVAQATTWLNQARWESDYTINYNLTKDMPEGVERELVVERITEYLGRQDGGA